MSEERDRLALIARAGQRLRTGKGMVVGEALPADPSTPHQVRITRVVEPGADRILPSSEAVPLRVSIPEAERESVASSGPQPVRLNYQYLRRSGMLTPDNLRSSLGFEFRAIKRKLLTTVRAVQEQEAASNLVMVTSASPAEGKTFTSANLAIALAAERDLRVLLIDGDVVRPRLGLMFTPNCEMGLTEYLNGKCDDSSQITHPCTELPNLSVIFSGKPGDHTPELLGSRRMGDLCKVLSKQFRNGIVIIDTPPVLASSETVNIAGFMSQILMVVASRQTRKAHLEAALENVAICPNISLLLNKAPAWSKVEGDTYYYYGSYGDDRAEHARHTR